MTIGAHDGDVDALMEAGWAKRARRITGLELRLECRLTVLFLVTAAGLLVAGGPAWPTPIAGLVMVGYAAASRANFQIGAGGAVPTLPLLVTLFAVAPAGLVPLLVWAALMGGEFVAGRGRRPDRAVLCGGDALHAIGPAAVLVAFADGDILAADPVILLGALAAQLALDFLSPYVHDRVIHRVSLRVHAKAMLLTWAVDAMLLPVGVVAAIASERWTIAALAPLPLIGLLRGLAIDRQRKIDAAHERLQALEDERERHGAAVRRLGTALGSTHDADAILAVVADAAAELVHGGVERLPFDPGLTGPHAPASGLFTIGAASDHATLLRVTRADPLDPSEIAALEDLCERATTALAAADAHVQLRTVEARLVHQAHHDPLTGLANRDLFGIRLREALRRNTAGRSQVALMFIDLDDFKGVNDTLGHAAGDELLVRVAGILESCTRGPADLVARLGGDEFAVLLEGRGTLTGAQEVALRLLESLVGVARASVGLTIAAPEVDEALLVRQADLAMYESKHAGGGRVTTYREGMVMGFEAGARFKRASEAPR